MVAILKKYKISYPDPNAPGTLISDYFLSNPATYTGLTVTDTGVVEATDAEQVNPHVNVEELVRSPSITGATMYYIVSGKRRSAKLLIDSSKFPAFAAKMRGKTYREGTVVSVMKARKARYL